MAHETGLPVDSATILTWCQEASAGNANSLERLIWAYHGRFMGIARRKIGIDWRGKIDPEDVLQETYIEVYKSISHFRPQGEDAFYHWVAQIIHQRFIDQVRRSRRKKRDVTREVRAAARPDSSYDGLLNVCAVGLESPSGMFRRAEATGALLACMAQLPEHYRVVVERWYLNEEPLSQIAADLNRSEDAVRRIASRAVARLAACLGRASHFLSSHD